MENTEDMSTKITDLNNIKDLSENIEKELENGEANSYISNNLDELQELQIKQLREIQKMQENNLNKQADSEVNTSETTEEKDIKNKKNNISKPSLLKSVQKILQEPFILLFLYVFISHNCILNNLGKLIPSLISEKEVTFKNLLVRGIILVSIYFNLKMFVLN